MITRALLLLLLSGFAPVAFSQCRTTTESTSETTSDDSGWNWLSSDDDDSESDSGGWEVTRLPFRIGYGQYYSLYTSSRTLANPAGLEVDKSWLSSRPLNVIEFWFRIGERRRGAFGTAIAFRKMGTYKSSTSIDVPEELAGDPGRHPLTYDFKKKANALGASAFYEHSLIGEADDIFRLTTRVDMGFTSYSYNASISYRDTCNCLQTPLRHDYSTSMVFSTRLGIGAELDFGPVGLKGLIGYEFQSATSFTTKHQFDSWYGDFDRREYNYNGMPDDTRFSVPQYSEDRIRFRNGFLYAGFSLYVNLGDNPE